MKRYLWILAALALSGCPDEPIPQPASSPPVAARSHYVPARSMEGIQLFTAGDTIDDTAAHYSAPFQVTGMSLGIMADWTGDGVGTWDILASNRKEPNEPSTSTTGWVSIYTLDANEQTLAAPDGGTTLIAGVQLNVAFEWYAVRITLSSGSVTWGSARAVQKAPVRQ